jgi:5-methylcytosine-specific restriction endonuclease McrA
MKENESIPKIISIAELMKLPEPTKEQQIDLECNYRRGFWHGVLCVIEIIHRLYSLGYGRPKEIANIIERWAYKDIQRWKSWVSDDYKKRPDWNCGHPPFSFKSWYSMRSETIKKDCGKCVLCGSSELLEVDHFVSVLDGGIPEEGNLRTLCRSCHKQEHRDN